MNKADVLDKRSIRRLSSTIQSVERDIAFLYDKLEFMNKMLGSGKYKYIEFGKRIAIENFVNQANSVHAKVLKNIEFCTSALGIQRVSKNSKATWSTVIDNAGKKIIEQEEYNARMLRETFEIIENALDAMKLDVLKISSFIDEQTENE